MKSDSDNRRKDMLEIASGSKYASYRNMMASLAEIKMAEKMDINNKKWRELAEQLDDKYIRKILCQEKIHAKQIDENPEIVELVRLQLLTKRKLK